jgi:hypothetical protein
LRLPPILVGSAFEIADTPFELLDSHDSRSHLLPQQLNRIFAAARFGRERAFQ